jgi:hypothetical protein
MPLDAFASIEQIAVLVEEQQHRGCCCSIVHVQDLYKDTEWL